MALVEIMRLWSEGVAAAENEDWNGALKSFTSITDPRSKICFNIGCCHLVLGDLEKAEKAFTLTIERDMHLAVGYFQRGFVFFQRGKYSLALKDWTRAYTEMRGNQLIDYKILGLIFKLYSCEILHNIALTHAKEGKWAKAEESILLALSQKVELRHNTKLEKAMEDILKEKVFAAVKIPKGRIFQPNERLVEQLEKKDYLGKALVVASVVDKDSFSGFAPLQPQASNPPPRPKTPEILRTLQGEPHRVLFEFNPETAEEMQVLPGNIVFVLKKGDDNWATVVFNGKKGIVPCNYLEPVELRFQSAQQTGVQSEELDSPTNRPQQSDVPAPPDATPPQLLKNTKDKQDFSASSKQKLQETEAVAVASYLVKVYYKYTVAIQISSKLPFADLLTLISSKLQLLPSRMKLSFKEDQDDVLLNEENTEKAWSLATDNCLKLKCTEVQVEEPIIKVEEVQVQQEIPASDKAETYVTALFEYEATQPEDLPFCKGDIIKILSHVSEDWWEGECQGRMGIFPKVFTEEIQ
ncbi:neutrophil cytosol factor 2 [Xenopus tropicalis]|uniref:Neutrophil cytosol factor 2 n=1 Tax=Xenopus tropicalis TaxID=8364 RepID=Q499C5_XENTR|nr:neutrophil cytosol factor 2 [Xenopus tropicalis]AAH99979.1 neutrophil cytosolic factor 2 [Xenopus tropicalis]|eukprot:NP_001029119.1 neutrophil cytosol factor 2 [Xenopus tropicalis]